MLQHFHFQNGMRKCPRGKMSGWNCPAAGGFECLPTRWRRKPAGIHIQRNDVTVSLCMHCVPRRTSTFYFVDIPLKIEWFELFFVHRFLEKFYISDMYHVHSSWKMLPLYLVKGRSYASGQIFIAFLKNWMHFKQPIVSPHAKWNFRYTSQKLFKISTICVHQKL